MNKKPCFKTIAVIALSAKPRMPLFAAALAVLVCSAGLAAADAGAAVSWLEARQQPDGSFGAWQEHATAGAALALAAWNSPNASLSLDYLRAAAENSESWFYGAWGEADVPGAVAFALGKTLHSVNASRVADNLLPFQNESSGGFRGYYDFGGCGGAGCSVDSSVDSSLALLGLRSLQAMPPGNSSAAVSFLSSLENADGSFNLTSSREFDSIYSLGPNKPSETALALLAFKAAGVPAGDERIQRALSFLRASASENYGGSAYAASLAAITFNEYGEVNYVSSTLSFLLALQHADGGFADASRSSNASNALDTGFAAYALSFAPSPSPIPSPFPSPSPSPGPSPSPSPSPSPTPTPTATPTPTLTPTPTPTIVIVFVTVPAPSPSSTPSPSLLPSPSPSTSPSPSPSPSPTPTQIATPARVVTSTPVSSPTLSPSSSPAAPAPAPQTGLVTFSLGGNELLALVFAAFAGFALLAFRFVKRR